MSDAEAVAELLRAADVVTQRGLAFGRAGDPELYREIEGLVATGRARLELVICLNPPRVELRVVDVRDGRPIASAFEFREPEPEERPH
ncbi:MAG: hypothetical protein JNL68_02160 [Burkholderiales bacterium]|nr:hypothetical protein [Burkholderiales bacterium]